MRANSTKFSLTFFPAALFYCAYVLAGGFGQGLALIPGVAVTFWPPAGIFSAVLLLTTRRSWLWWIPVAAAAELTCNAIWFHNPVHFALIYFTANALVAITVATLLKRFGPQPLRLETLEEVAMFTVIGGGIAPVVSATIIATTDAILGKHAFWTAWPLVWIGDGAGLLVTMPLTIVAVQAWRERHVIAPSRILEAAVLSVVLLIVLALALTQYLPTLYVAMPPLLWAAARFRLKGAAVCLAVLMIAVAAMAMSGRAQQGEGLKQLQERSVDLQVFLGLAAISSLFVAAISQQRHDAIGRLRKVNSDLEQHVADRSLRLRESEGRLHFAAEATGVGFFDIEPRTGAYTLSDVALQLWGFEPGANPDFEKMLGMCHPEDRKMVRAATAACLDPHGDGKLKIEHRLIRPDGSTRWLATTAKAMFANGPERRAVRCIGTMMDVTERRLAQNALQRNADAFYALVKGSPFGVFLVDADFKVAEVSAGAAIVFDGIGPVIGRDLSDMMRTIWPEPFASEAISVFRHTLESGEPYLSENFVERRADREREESYDWRTERVIMPDGRFGVVCHFYDLTERRRLEAVLRESEARFRNMADHSPVMIWLTEPDGTCTFLSKSWYEFTGQTPETGLGFGWLDAVHPDDRAESENIFRDASSDRKSFRLEYRLRRHDGVYCWAIDAAQPRFDPGRRFMGFIGSVIDITDRKHAEATMRNALDKAVESERLKDEFLATLSHELRTPMSAILGWTQILSRGAKSEADMKRGIEVIDRNARHQRKIIEDLLDVNRILAGKMRLDVQSISPATFIEGAAESIRPAAEAKHISLRVSCSVGTDTIRGDPNRLQQVIFNLLSNAVKFTPRDGSIEVSCQRTGSFLELRVVDSGKGIAPEFVPHVFERFRQQDASTTRAFGGLGLGLSIVKQIVEMHGGTVHAQSDGEGLGATFIVRIPLAMAIKPELPPGILEPNPPAPPRRSEPFTGSENYSLLRGKTVVVVDDQPDARELISSVLQQHGVNCVLFESARHTLEYFQNGGKADLIISDVGMPEMNGYELLSQLRQAHLTDGPPAIALTAFARPEDNTRAIASGFQMHLSKPVEITELLAAVVRVIEQAESSVPR